jgi:RepB DNA-primase from phage plasmid
VRPSEVIPQDVARRLQLVMFRGNEPDGALLEFRYRRPGGTMRRLGFYDARNLDRISGEIERTARSADVWVGAAPRAREDGTVNGVARGWCLWADLDGCHALEQLLAFPVQPSIVIRSGSDCCAHAYWPLREPLSAADLQRANRRLALALGADMAATDAARILRVAGTLNHKHEPPREVICTRLELDIFTATEIVGSLPDSHHYTRPPRSGVQQRSNDPDRVLDALVRTVRNAQIGNRNHATFWAVCRAVEHADTGELDECHAVEEIRTAALDVGLPEHEVEATIRSGLAQRASIRQAA